MKNFTGSDIRKIRAALGYTQESLASVIGVTKTTVGRYEFNMSFPTGKVALRILLLENTLRKNRERLRRIAKSPQGVIAIAVLLAMGETLISREAAEGFGMDMFSFQSTALDVFDIIKNS